MRRHNVFALGVSVLLHLGVPALVVFTVGSKVVPLPAVKPVPLSLNMFKQAPPPKVVEQVNKPVAVAVAKVEPPPPKPKPKVKLRPKPKPKLTQKPKPVPEPESEPEPQIEPIVDEVIEAEVIEPQIVVVQPEVVPIATPPAQAQRQPPQSTMDPSKLALIEASYQSRLRELIEAKKTYPRRAKRMGREGMATVSFVVLADGTIEAVELREGSGTKVLDQAAMNTIISLSGILPFPSEINRSRWVFTIPIAYDLL